VQAADNTKGFVSGNIAWLNAIEVACAGSWVVLDQDFTLELRTSSFIRPGTGGFEMRKRSTLIVATNTSRTDYDAAFETGSSFVALRDPNGVSPRILYLNTDRFDFPTILQFYNPNLINIQGLDLVTIGPGYNFYKLYFGNATSVVSNSNIRIFGGTGGFAIAQYYNSTYDDLYSESLAFDSESNLSTATLNRPTFYRSSTGNFRGGLRGTNLVINNPTFLNNCWDQTIYLDSDLNAQSKLSVNYSLKHTFKAGLVGLQNITARYKRSLQSAANSPAWGTPANGTIAVTSNSSGTFSPINLLDTYREGTQIEALQRFNWSAKARLYNYRTAADEIFTNRVFYQGNVNLSQGYSEEVQMLLIPASVLSLSSSAAAALSGISFSAIGTTSGTVTLTTNRTISEVFAAYRVWISTLANFDSVDSWDSDGVTLNVDAWNLTINGCTLTGNITTAGTLTFDVTGAIVSSASVMQSGATIVVASNKSFLGWTFTNTTINVSNGTATVTVDSTTGITAGMGVTLETPQASLTVPAFEDGTRFYAARYQTFLVAASGISTGANTIALGHDMETGATFAGQITPPATLAYVLLASGATLPTSSPQLQSGNLYYVSANSSGVVQLSESEGGTALDFSAAGTNNGTGQTLIIVCTTQLINQIVSGGSGVTQALALPNNAKIEIAAQNVASGEAAATTLFSRVIAWNNTTGATIADTFSLANNPDPIYNELIGATITSKRGLAVTVTTTPSTVAGLSFDLSGNIELDANAIVDALIPAPDAYVWMIYQRYTQTGIRFIRNQLIALSIMEIDLTGQLRIDNTADGTRNSPATPLVILGNVYTAEGAEMYAPNTGTVRIEPFFVSDLTSAGDGSFTSDDRAKVEELHKIHGLNASNPLTVSNTARAAGSVTQTIADDGTTTTVTRT
jgi:hypothetical protein